MKRNLTLDEETLAAYLRGDVDAETAAAVSWAKSIIYCFSTTA